MSENSILATKFYLTARAGEQLHNSLEKTEKKEVQTPVLTNYESVSNQDMCTGKEENKAIRYGAYANFSLNNSSSVKNYNNYLKQIELNKKSA